MRVGVTGLGRVGQMHAANLAATAGVDEVVLVGRDPERTRAARAAVEAAVQPGAQGSGSGPAGLSSTTAPLAQVLGDLDAVVLATSTATHPELTLQCARAGVPTLVEKPLSLDPAGLADLADELDATGTPVAVAFHRRYDPAHQLLAERVARGDAGAIRLVRAVGHDHLALSLDYIPRSGGIWMDMVIHDLDAIGWVTGQRVRSVWATGSVLDEPAYARHDDVDTAAAVLTLESGALALVSAARRNGAGQDVRLEVHGTLDTFGAGVEARTPTTSTEPGVPPPGPAYEQFVDRFAPAFRAEVAHLVRLARGEAENLTPPRAGLHAVQVAAAAARSRRTGAPVEVPG